MTTVISPVEVINTIKPKNGLPFAVVEDSDVLGGFHGVLTLAERDAIPSGLLKLGMAVFVVATIKTYFLTSLSPITWTEDAGGGVDASTLPVDTSSWTGLLDGLTTVQQALNFVDTMLSDVIGPYTDSAVGLHASATSGVHGISTFGASLVDDADAAAARTTLGLTAVATTDPLELLATIATIAGSAVDTHAALTSGVHGISTFGASLVDDADAAAARTTLGLGTAATQASTAFEAAGAVATHTGASDPHGDRAFASALVAGLTAASVGADPAGTAASAVASHSSTTSGVHGISTFGASLVDDADAATARATLGLGTAATQASSAFEAAGAVAAGIASHVGASDPHGDRAFASALVAGLTAASVGADPAGTAASAVSAHAAVTSGVHGISTFGASLIDDADAAAARTTLGLGTAAIQASTAFEAAGAVATHAGASDPHGDRAFASALVAGLTAASVGADPAGTAASAVASHAAVTSGVHGISTFGASLVDDADAATARTTLGLAAVASSGSAADLSAGTLSASRLPAFTGDVTTTAGSSSTTIATGAVSSSKLGVDITTAGKALLTAADASAQRTALGLGTAATQASSAFETAGAVASGIASHVGASDPHGDRAFASALVAGLTAASVGADPAGTAASAVSAHAAVTSGVHGISTFGASLVDDADAAAARTTLGLGTAATQASAAFEAAGAVASHSSTTSGVHGISTFGANLVDDADASTARGTLGLGTAATRNISAGTAAPSGGSDGDIYLQYT